MTATAHSVGREDWRGSARRLATLVICLTALISGMIAAHAQVGFDRPGGDYASASVRSGDPAVCAARCDRDNRCRAWSFSYPRTAARDAMCRLKNSVTAVKEDSCCVSGVRGAALVEPRGGLIEFSIDRYGGLSLGESSYLVDSISMSKAPPAEATFLRREPHGFYSLPVWVDHQDSAKTRTERFSLVSLDVPSALDRCWMILE